MTSSPPNEWSVLRITGADRETFFQGLLTTDVIKQAVHSARYSLMLTPQGKFLFDLFLYKHDDALSLIYRRAHEAALLKKLTLHRLRSDVRWEVSGMNVEIGDWALGTGDKKENTTSFPDPRNEKMGVWHITSHQSLVPNPQSLTNYHSRRITLGLAEGEHDMISGEDFPLEFNMDKIGAIDFDKGCYMGQEVTARTKYRGNMKKKLCRIHAKENITLPARGEILRSTEGAVIGEMLSSIDMQGLALLRIEAIEALESDKDNFRFSVV